MELKKLGNSSTEIVFSDGGRVLYSHETPVAAFTKKGGYYKTSTFFSQTTSKHIEAWLPRNAQVRVVSQEAIAAFAKGAQ